MGVEYGKRGGSGRLSIEGAFSMLRVYAITMTVYRTQSLTVGSVKAATLSSQSFLLLVAAKLKSRMV